jgi:hypothetical protein
MRQWLDKNRWLATALAGAVLACGLLSWYWLDDAAAAAKGSASSLESASIMSALPAAPASSAAGSAAGGPFSAAGLANRQEQLVVWRQRLERASEVYNSYRDATRYPHESRPLSEHTDQLRPFDPVAEDKALRDAAGNVIKGFRLRTTQERVFLGGAESVKFTVAAVDDKGAPVALSVTSARAQTVPDTTALISVISANVAFNDDGTGPDAAAADGTYSARLSPSTQGFASHAGTIRLLAQVTAGGQSAVAHFDVVYAPLVPAAWAGVREAAEGGSLNFYLKAQVKVAGRYVVSARVFDAKGTPLALLQFNDQVAAGTSEFKLSLFGALIRDAAPEFPLRLVDVDGFLLQTDTFPDRALMARQPGVVHTSQRYSSDTFSNAEWSGPERERYLTEYGRDVQEAQDQLARLK